MDNYLKKVNKVLLGCLALGIPLSILFTFIGVFHDVKISLSLIIGVMLSGIFIKKDNSQSIVRIINLITIFMFIAFSMIELPEACGVNAIFGLIAAALYFNKWIPVLYGVGLNIVTFYIQFNEKVFNTNTLLDIMGCTFFSVIILFFLTKWGFELINDASNKEKKSNDLLSQIENSMDILHKNTIILDDDNLQSYEKLATINDTSNSISESVHEMEEGVCIQTESIAKISDMMSEADLKVSEVNEFIKELKNVSGESNVMRVKRYMQ